MKFDYHRLSSCILNQNNENNGVERTLSHVWKYISSTMYFPIVRLNERLKRDDLSNELLFLSRVIVSSETTSSGRYNIKRHSEGATVNFWKYFKAS